MGTPRGRGDMDGLGVLDTEFPLREVQQILRETGRESKRKRKLPASQMVYYVIALGLMASVGARQVLRHLLDHVREDGPVHGPLATEAAITKARQRLGVEPLKELFGRFVRPLAKEWLKSAWYRSWRVVSLDGTTLRVLDTDANEQRFGRPAATRGKTAYPQVRLVGLLENGTRILFAVAVDAYAVAENALARLVVPRLTKGMLCLADRGFFGYELWNQTVATGADLLWRVKSTLNLGPLERLPDGSYLGTLRRGTIKQVRVIKFTLTFKNGRCEHYRLITTILDYRRAPAAELAHLYAKRWKIETMFDELKVRIGGPKLLLRSATPDLVEQDVYGLLLAHFGIRHEMIGAAHEQGFDPEELSFVNALHVIIRRLPEMVSFSPSAEAALP
jgi:transposase IS4-like protein/DDE family transposase